MDEARRRGIMRHDFFDPNHKPQYDLIRSPARRKAALVSRRGGKSEGMQRYMMHQGYEYPGTLGIYLALTRDSARNIMWPIVEKLWKQFELGSPTDPLAGLSEHTLTAKLPNGSRMIYVGVDTFDRQMEKYLGIATNIVVLDECASYRIPLTTLVDDILIPTTMDYRAPIVAVGNVGLVPAGWFYDLVGGEIIDGKLTQNKIPGWELHTWGTEQNPYMAEAYKDLVAELEAADPNARLKPSFQRQYERKWIGDKTNLVFEYDPDINLARNLPDLPPGEKWTYGVGIDFGFNDPTAFVVLAWSSEHPRAYIVETHKESEMDADAINEKLKELDNKWGLTWFVVDPASKQFIEDIRKRFAWPFTSANKAGKVEFIKLLNNDLSHGRLMVLPEALSIVDELAILAWAPDKTPPVIPEGSEDHLCDAMRYIWKHATGFMHEEEPNKPEAGTKEYYDDLEKTLRSKAIERFTPNPKKGFL